MKAEGPRLASLAWEGLAPVTATVYTFPRPSKIDHSSWMVSGQGEGMDSADVSSAALPARAQASGQAAVGSPRLTAELEGDFVVFMIGMRVNQPWKISAWLPVFRAMPKMLAELARHPELGLLGGRFAGTTLIQYW